MQNGSNQVTPAPLGTAYRKEMRRLAGKAKFFVSTLDTNILSLADITAALTEARIVEGIAQAKDKARFG